MTRRRWIADRWSENSAVLLDAQAAHLARVLRAQVGQEFDIVAGNTVRRGVVEQVAVDVVEFSLHEEVEAAGSLPLVVALSIVRFERMEWAIEKLTEIGVARMIPLIAQRSEKHLVQAAAKRKERWGKIARESAQQSRRVAIPEICDPMSIAQCIAEVPEACGCTFVRAGANPVAVGISDDNRGRSTTATAAIYAAIGPEGGWTPAELSSFADAGWRSVEHGSAHPANGDRRDCSGERRQRVVERRLREVVVTT